jgi:hypothetical protein
LTQIGKDERSRKGTQRTQKESCGRHGGGNAEVMRSPFLSVAPYRLVAAARGTSRRDGRALRIVEAAAARSAACEREFGAGTVDDQRLR